MRLLSADKRADVAQLVEHSLGKGEVTSSILVIGSRVKNATDFRGSAQIKKWVIRQYSHKSMAKQVMAGVTQW